MGETSEVMTVEPVGIGKHFSKLGLMFFLGTLIIYAVQIGANELVKWAKPEWLENPNISLAVVILPMYLIGMPLLIALVKRVPGTVPEKHSMKVWQFLLALVMCFCVMYVSNIVGSIITAIIGMLKGGVVNNVILDIASSTSLIVSFVYMVICAPIMEEFIFRKLIVDRTLRYGQGVAILVSGLMFGLFHGNLNQFVYATTMGMFLAFLYVKTGNIKYTIGIHMIVNFFGSIVSVLLMEAMNYDDYTKATLAGAGTEELMQLLMASLPGWIGFFIYLCLILAMVIGGIVLFIVFRKRFATAKGEVEIPKGKGFSTIFVNIGMGLYVIFWLIAIVRQLLL